MYNRLPVFPRVYRLPDTDSKPTPIEHRYFRLTCLRVGNIFLGDSVLTGSGLWCHSQRGSEPQGVASVRWLFNRRSQENPGRGNVAIKLGRNGQHSWRQRAVRREGRIAARRTQRPKERGGGKVDNGHNSAVESGMKGSWQRWKRYDWAGPQPDGAPRSTVSRPFHLSNMAHFVGLIRFIWSG